MTWTSRDAVAGADIFTTAVLLLLPVTLWREMERQAAQTGAHIAELARTACSRKDSELDELDLWAYTHVKGKLRTHKFLIRMSRKDADRLKRQAAKLGCPRSALMRACIAAHLHAQPDLPME